MKSRVTGEVMRPALRGDVTGKDGVVCKARHVFTVAGFEMVSEARTWSTHVIVHLFADGSGFVEVLRDGKQIELRKWDKESQEAGAA